MKSIVLFCEGMADEPIVEFGSRTPLELAKKPAMDFLARTGAVGLAQFVPQAVRPTADVACLAALGYDPLEHYTGIAPLEALAMGVPQEDREIAFRCDLVTVDGETLIDMSAGHITPRESKLLIEELNRVLANTHMRFHAGDGHKNLLLVRDFEKTDEYDDLECIPPSRLIGQKYDKSLPKGRAADAVRELMKRSREVLETHEINRVRIDLKENPANMIWPWGQGQKPHLPDFRSKYGADGAVVSDSDYVRGLGKAAGLQVYPTLEKALDEKDFVFVYVESGNAMRFGRDLKAKIKAIEEFDATVVRPALKYAEGRDDVRILVGTDVPESLEKKALLHGHTPFTVWGAGFSSDEAAVFSEKAASQSPLKFDQGWKLMEFFMKGKK